MSDTRKIAKCSFPGITHIESKYQAEEAEGNSVLGHPQHRGGDSFDCAGRGQHCIGSFTAPRGDSFDCYTEWYEIVVYSDQARSGYKLFDTLMVFLKDF